MFGEHTNNSGKSLLICFCKQFAMMANVAQGIYSPLPQNLSDSDSEKELQMDSLRPKYSQNGSLAYNNGCPIAVHVDPKKKHGFQGMSTLRKCFFIFSILLCFFMIFIFLWILPCNDGTCPVKILSWDRKHEDIELKGNINVVAGVFRHSHNLALLFRGNILSDEDQNGAISILGNSGGVAWYIPQNKVPDKIKCEMDVNGDNVKDCLLIGNLGLKAVDPVSGEILWHVRKADNNKPIKNIDFPVVLPDLNYDGTDELIATVGSNKVLLISGRTGLVLGSFVLKHCQTVKSQAIRDLYFVYLCLNASKEEYYKVALENLKNRIVNNTAKIETSRTGFEPNSDGFRVSDRKLIVTNRGACPDCSTNITLIDEKTGKRIINWFHLSSYTMTPTSFSFNPTKTNLSLLKGHVNGFILKFWQWSGNPKQKTIAKRNIPTTNMTINAITERIVLVTFNNTNFHIINASSVDIVQLCFLNENGSSRCQPDLENQTESLLIADLDDDESQELVSFSTSFEKASLGEKWRLVSSMKLIRLEAELPQLYEGAK